MSSNLGAYENIKKKEEMKINHSSEQSVKKVKSNKIIGILFNKNHKQESYRSELPQF